MQSVRVRNDPLPAARLSVHGKSATRGDNPKGRAADPIDAASVGPGAKKETALNQAQRVAVIDGEPVMDPWALFENWLEKYGLTERMDHDPLPVVDDYFNFCKAEAVTGSLFAGADVREGRA